MILDIERIDASGNSKKKIDKVGLPPAGELKRVLFDIVLKVDRNLELPGVSAGMYFFLKLSMCNI